MQIYPFLTTIPTLKENVSGNYDGYNIINSHTLQAINTNRRMLFSLVKKQIARLHIYIGNIIYQNNGCYPKNSIYTKLNLQPQPIKFGSCNTQIRR